MGGFASRFSESTRLQIRDMFEIIFDRDGLVAALVHLVLAVVVNNFGGRDRPWRYRVTSDFRLMSLIAFAVGCPKCISTHPEFSPYRA